MDVFIVGGPPQMSGQIVLSMPSFPCLECVSLLNTENLAREAAAYGDAGPRPQVVWANGVLASTAVGITVDLLTDWTKSLRNIVYLSYIGNNGTVTPHIRLNFLGNHTCPHYPISNVGDPVFKKI